jgi:peptidoglycan/LPS O-acetylase OafA/YrhL
VGCYFLSERRFQTAVPIIAVCIAQLLIRQNLYAVVAGSLAAILIISPPNFAQSQVMLPLKKTGLISYSLYLVHVPIGCYLAVDYMPWKLGRQLWPSLLQDSILLTCCLVFARLFYGLVERPAHEYARQRSQRIH